MLIQTSLQILSLNFGARAGRMGVPRSPAFPGTLWFRLVFVIWDSQVLTRSTWFCCKFSSGVDPTRPGRLLEFQGEQLTRTKTSLAADRRREAGDLQKPSGLRQGVPQAGRPEGEWRRCVGRGACGRRPGSRSLAPTPNALRVTRGGLTGTRTFSHSGSKG